MVTPLAGTESGLQAHRKRDGLRFIPLLHSMPLQHESQFVDIYHSVMDDTAS